MARILSVIYCVCHKDRRGVRYVYIRRWRFGRGLATDTYRLPPF